MADSLPSCSADRGDDVLDNMLVLLRRQDDHIWLTQAALYRLCSDSRTMWTETFSLFLRYFWSFTRQHYASAGFSDALSLLHVTDGGMYERLVGGRIIDASEQLARAAGCLDKLLSAAGAGDLALWRDVDNLLCEMETTQLRIMEALEKIPVARQNGKILLQ